MVRENGYAVGPPLLPTPRPSAPLAAVCVHTLQTGGLERQVAGSYRVLVLLMLDTQPSQEIKILCSSFSSKPKKLSFPSLLLFRPGSPSLGLSLPLYHPFLLVSPSPSPASACSAPFRGLSELLQQWRWCCFIRTWGQYWWPPVSVKPIETVVTRWRGFQPEGTSHDSFKSTQIKLFMAWKWPHRMGATEPPEKPNTIVMDITRREQQRAEETSVDREQNSSRLFREAGQGMLTGRWMVCLTLWKWMGAPWNKCILIDFVRTGTQKVH